MKKDKMIRKQIYLEANQDEKVKMISARAGKTEAEVIREALNEYIVRKHQDTEDPLLHLIGFVKTKENTGSVMHDQHIYVEDGDQQ